MTVKSRLTRQDVLEILRFVQRRNGGENHVPRRFGAQGLEKAVQSEFAHQPVKLTALPVDLTDGGNDEIL